MAAHLKILIVTDAWSPQVNGVVRTLETLGRDLSNLGHTVHYVTPLGRRTFPLPTYPEIRLALFQRRALTREIREFAPDAVHIATEGSLGLTTRRICLKHGIAFTTAFHTRFAEYVHARFRMVPERVIWRWLRWFHYPATAVMVATETLRRELSDHGFKHLRIWSRGVDIEKFHPMADARLPYEGPLWLYVGRVAVEKNIEAFLSLDIPGTKVVVGDGPARGDLSRKYPEVKFLGALSGIAVPQSLPVGTVMAISVDYERYAELKTSSRYALVVKSTAGEIVNEIKLEPSGNLSVFIQQFKPEHRPFTARIEELTPGSNRRTIVSNEVTLKTDY